MSKMESGEIIIEEVPFSLKNILDEIVELIEVQAIEQGLQFDAKRFLCWPSDICPYPDPRYELKNVLFVNGLLSKLR